MFFSAPKIEQLTGDQLMEALQKKSPPFILDVRTPGEFRQGHIRGAVLIPVTELASRMSEVPTDREVVTVCHSGNRSMMAARHLEKAGYQVKNLQSGMMRWPGPVERGV